MSTLEERYEGNFLEADDLPQGILAAVKITALANPNTEKDGRGTLIKNAILTFEGKKKRLILNKTSYSVLKELFGLDAKKWTGQTVHLQRRYLPPERAFREKGEPWVPCVRIVPPKGTPLKSKVRDFLGQVAPPD
jgi:hypothetical protein